MTCLTLPLPIIISYLCENHLPYCLPNSHLCEIHMCICMNCNGDISLHAWLKIANQNGQWHGRDVILHFYFVRCAHSYNLNCTQGLHQGSSLKKKSVSMGKSVKVELNVQYQDRQYSPTAHSSYFNRLWHMHACTTSIANIWTNRNSNPVQIFLWDGSYKMQMLVFKFVFRIFRSIYNVYRGHHSFLVKWAAARLKVSPPQMPVPLKYM